MAFNSNRDGGVVDSIRCDQQNYLIWKWHPQGTSPTSSQRANAIRFGSSLRVREGSVAVFVYATPEGTRQDFIVGPYDGIVETNNFPVLSTLIGKFFDGGTPFPAEVYFINMADLIQVKFGVPYFDIFDPRFTDYGIPVAVRGSINFRITDCRGFIRLHRLDQFGIDTFERQIKDSVVRLVKEVVSNAPINDGIPAVQIERHLAKINELATAKVSEALLDSYGVTVTRMDIAAIEINKNSEGYKKLQAITQNKASVFTQAAANIVDTMGTHRVGAKRIRQTVEEEGKPLEGGIDLGEVGKNVGQMLGNAADALGEAAGGTANAISGLFSRIGKAKEATPPPVPTVKYYVVLEGEQAGPFTVGQLSEMAVAETFSKDTLVWKEGMDGWETADTIDELGVCFKDGEPGVPLVH